MVEPADEADIVGRGVRPRELRPRRNVGPCEGQRAEAAALAGAGKLAEPQPDMGEALGQLGPVELGRAAACEPLDRLEMGAQRFAVGLALGEAESVFREGDQAVAGLAKKSSSLFACSTIWDATNASFGSDITRCAFSAL